MADGTQTRRDPRHDILFEPVRIGPKLAKNRFYQVPHCNGMGYRDPTALAVMRGVKAEGGWAVVCTEEVEIHPSGDITPYIEGRLWDDRDIPALARQAEKIHEHGALAGIELCHNGQDAPNLWSREVPVGPTALPVAPSPTTRCRPAPWTARISAPCAAGTGTRRCGAERRASI